MPKPVSIDERRTVINSCMLIYAITFAVLGVITIAASLLVEARERR